MTYLDIFHQLNQIPRPWKVLIDIDQEISKMRIKMNDDIHLPVGDMYKDEVQKYIDDRTINNTNK